MKQFNTLLLIWLVSAALLSSLVCEAEVMTPCLIFTGDAPTEHSIDLAKLNRITFGDNSMTVSSSKDGSEPTVELLYSLYHRIEIGEAIPVVVGVEAPDAAGAARLYVDAPTKLLHLTADADTEYAVGVFNVDGRLLLTAQLSGGDAMTLEALAPGVYIAVAAGGDTKLSLKFILN